MHRVQKLLSNWGYCSRRKAEEFISKGRVKVNDKVIGLGDQASESDIITVDGKRVRAPRRVYLMLNKPLHCVTALRDPQKRTVMDYIRTTERVVPIGRLDYNTTGLLLFTNDGDFANKVMHPRYEIAKKYLVEANEPFSKRQIQQMKSGIVLEDGKTNPAWVKQIGPRTLIITIHEGRNRIVRRMVQALGLKVKFLQRIAVGKLELGTLAPGATRKLTKKELDSIFM